MLCVEPRWADPAVSLVSTHLQEEVVPDFYCKEDDFLALAQHRITATLGAGAKMVFAVEALPDNCV